MLRKGEIQMKERKEFIEAQYLEELKGATVDNLKKVSYHGLVIFIRLYVRASSAIKGWWDNLKNQIKNLYKKNSKGLPEEKQEINKFLKMIGDYKRKVREIKHRIRREEEKNL